MVSGRREIAPREQIKALRHARDHYAQLADQIHNDTTSALDGTEKQWREDDARRIAKAYDRSLSNNVARLSGMEGTHKSTMRFFELRYWIGALLILTLACLPFAYRYASSRDGFLNRREIGDVASNAARNAPPAEIPSQAAPEQTPLAEKPEAPKRVEPDAPKPAIASAAPAPKDIVPPRAPVTKKVVAREPANAKPAAAKQTAQKPSEAAAASAPVQPVPPAQTQPALAPPALAPPALTQPAPAQPAPAAPPPAPVETPPPQVAATIPAPVAIPPVPAATRPEPIAETHTLPRYPQLSAQVGEAGTTRMSVAISPQGRAADCRITQSSGSERLDSAACAHVTDNWRWKPINRDNTTPAPRISVTMVWNLSRPSRGR